MNDEKICPRCGKGNKPTWNKCYYCGADISNLTKPQMPNNPNVVPPGFDPYGLYRCEKCGLFISPSADNCPRCGEPVKKIDPNNLDIVCFISIVITYFFIFIKNLWVIPFLVILSWLIYYQYLYSKYKDNHNYNIRTIKQTRMACFILFILFSISYGWLVL